MSTTPWWGLTPYAAPGPVQPYGFRLTEDISYCYHYDLDGPWAEGDRPHHIFLVLDLPFPAARYIEWCINRWASLIAGNTNALLDLQGQIVRGDVY